MPDTILGKFLGRFGNQTPGADRTPDQDLVARFLDKRDESAFSTLMHRHSGMVLGVCKRILKNPHDAEDACQAVFLVLARRAGSIRSESVASWLYGVARNVAHKLLASQTRRTNREGAVAADKPTQEEPDDMSWREVQRVVDEELDRMPQNYQAPLVLCYLEGRTQDEAARELGCSLGALRGRLERGRDLLKSRLVRRGIVGASALVFSALLPSMTSAAPPSLIASTAAASVSAFQGTFPAAISAHVVSLVRAASPGFPWLKTAVAGLFILFVAASSAGILYCWPREAVAPVGRAMIKMRQVERFDVPNARVWSVAYSPDGKRLAAGLGRNEVNGIPLTGELRVWDLESKEVVFAVATPRSVRCVVFAPDGKTIATAEHEGVARIREADTGKVLFTLGGHKTQVDCVAFSRDGGTLFTTGWDGTVTLWNTATGEPIRSMKGHQGQVFSVATGGPDGSIASGGVDNIVRVWRPETGELLHTLPGHTDVAHWVAFAPPDGRLLASASWDKTVKLWDSRGKPHATLRGHTESVLAVAFSPDGKTLASSAGRREVKESPGEIILWDVAKCRTRAHIHYPDRVYGVAFSPDSETLAVAGWDGAVSFWNADPDQPLRDDEEQKQFVFAVDQGDATPDLKREYAADFHPVFKEDTKEATGLTLFGPDAAEAVHFEADRLHIDLKAGYPRRRFGTGVVTDFGVKGDFDISLTYDVVQEPSAGNVRALKLVIVPDEPALPDVWHLSNQNRASIARDIAVLKTPGQFVAEATTWNPEVPQDQWGNDLFQDVEKVHKVSLPTEAKSGQLRLVRSGKTLYFLAGETDKELTLLHQSEFGLKDLRQIRVVGQTGGQQAALDIRVTDIRIRGDAFVKAGGGVVPVAAVDTPASPGGRLWMVVAAAVATLAILLVALGVWLVLRLRRSPSPVVSAKKKPIDVLRFTCESCGMRLKAKRERAGKKLTCPGCSKVMTVPDND